MVSVPATVGGNIFSFVSLDGYFAAFLLLGVRRGFWQPSRVHMVSGKPMFTRITKTAHGRGDFSGCGAPLIAFLPLSTALLRGSPTSDY